MFLEKSKRDIGNTLHGMPDLKQSKIIKMNNNNFDRYPKEFLKDVFIELHLFDNPERDEHADYVNIQCKHDLFNFAYDRITDAELFFLKRSEDHFRLKEIKACTNVNYGYLQ